MSTDQQKSSKFLSLDENATISKLLGENVEVLSIGIVQLMTSKSEGKSWTKVLPGAVCFVKDWKRRGYFIEVRINQLIILLIAPKQANL
jgi:hypothetical protein